ncbi:MAG: DUF1835 domain-containing protein [bacterium]
MKKPTLHITNGNVLTDYLNELDIKGQFLTWQEMLCEGPTKIDIESDEFIALRRNYLSTEYNIEIDEYEFHDEIDKLNHLDDYSEIVLWFEYDLFCHINMIAVIHHILSKKNKLPVYLVCSGRVKGESDFKGLGELKPNQLLRHYRNKILLNNDDLDMASNLWQLYCGKDHNLIKPFIVKTSSFQYLNSCLKAHLKRFPDSKNGLGRLEHHILETINLNEIKSENHLLGYVLNYQGYYGYGDLQIRRLIKKLNIFLSYSDKGITLNRKGHEALLGQHNFAKEVNNSIRLGGISRADFHFNRKENKLIKTIVNASA